MHRRSSFLVFLLLSGVTRADVPHDVPHDAACPTTVACPTACSVEVPAFDDKDRQDAGAIPDVGHAGPDFKTSVTAKSTEARWQWQTLTTNGLPTGRHETSLVESGGKFYMIGGRESRQIDRFDPETKTWSKMKVNTPLIHHFQPVIWGGKIYMVGAMTGGYPTEPPMDRVQIYDPTTDTWSEGDTIPEDRRRGGAGTAVYNNKIYVAGGITLGHTSGTNNWFDEYDPATGNWRKLPDAPHIRDHFHAVVLGDKFYCIGGLNTSYHTPKFSSFFGAVERAVDVYDFQTQSWSTLKQAPLPVGSAAAGTAVLDDRIVYFGGETATMALDTTWLFDPAKLEWTSSAKMNQGRHGSQAVVYGGRIYIAGGSPKRGGGNLDSIEVFSRARETPHNTSNQSTSSGVHHE